MERINNRRNYLKSIFYKFKKGSKLSITHLKNFSLLIVFLQGIIFSSIAISEPKLFRVFIEKFSRRILWSFDTFEINDYKYYIKDLFFALNPFQDNLERLDLSIDLENLVGLDCSRKYNASTYKNKIELIKNNCGRYWYYGTLSNNGNNFKVKLRSKGDRTIHYRNINSMSFKADIRGEEKFKGMEEFSIQSPIIRNYTSELLAAKIMRKENIISPRNYYVRFYINGEYKGIRHIEEGFSRELIEFHQRRYGPIFSIEEKFGKKFKNAIFDLHDSKYWNKDKSEINLATQARTILESSKTNTEYIKKYFDLNKWAKYFAIVDAFGLWHGSMPKSVKYFLNPVTGLIEPIFYDGHLNATRILENYNFYKIYEKENIYCAFICDPNENFYKNFFGTHEKPNDEFYSKYISHLKRISDPKYIRDNVNPIWKNLSTERGNLYKEFWRIDRISNPGIMPHIAPWNKIIKRINKINKDLKNSDLINPEIIIEERDLKIVSLKNIYSDIPLTIKLKCSENNYETKNFTLIKDKEIRIFNDQINSCELNNISYSINSSQSSYNIKNGYITDYDLKAKKNKKISELKESKIVFNKGFNKFDPEIDMNNKNIIFKPNSILCLNENSIFQIKNSQVKFEGTSEKPVVIKNCLNSAQRSGSLIIENSKIYISNLITNNLVKPKIKLRSLESGINIINSDLNIKKLTSNNSFSEDAINLINSKVNAKNINILNSISDGIDSDFSTIIIENINCKNIANDCFDSSFTNGIIDNIQAIDIGDKAISAGESSILKIANSNVNNAEIGLAVKDSSKVNIDNYIFKNVKLPITTYIKKEEFSSPILFIKSISVNNKDKENFLISNDSIVTIEGEKIKTYLQSKNIKKLLYGNQFGIKTKR